MSGFDAFMAGFLGQTANNISERKQEAKDYYDRKMELAWEKAHTFRTQNLEKMNGALQIANQMKQIGVPDDIVMAIANQNPDDLSTFYDTIQDMQMKGVQFTEQTYRDMLQVDSEFNPGNENITSLIQKIYQPLIANATADPESFEFDPKGTIWATMMGYNAMDRANQKLAETEVLPGISAQDILSDTGIANTGVLGSHAVTFNAPAAGEALQAAYDARGGGDELSIANITSIHNTFADIVEQEMVNPDFQGLSVEERRREAQKRAAIQIGDMFPMHIGHPSLAPIFRFLPEDYFGDGETIEETPSEEPPLEFEDAPESPSEPATEETSPETAPTSETPTNLPSELPNGAKLVKDNGDGTSQWKRPDGSPATYRNIDIEEALRALQGGAAAPQISIGKPPTGMGKSRPSSRPGTIAPTPPQAPTPDRGIIKRPTRGWMDEKFGG